MSPEGHRPWPLVGQEEQAGDQWALKALWQPMTLGGMPLVASEGLNQSLRLDLVVSARQLAGMGTRVLEERKG